MQNHFDLFNLPQQFAQDMAALDTAYRQLQGQVHPDRFVNASDADKRAALQWATHANEAYQTLKNPLKRAGYLCELNGVALNIENNTAMPAAFLMQQMEWREALQDARAARDVAALETLQTELRSTRKQRLQQLQTLLDGQNYEQAAQAVRQTMFLERFGEELTAAFDAVEN